MRKVFFFITLLLLWCSSCKNERNKKDLKVFRYNETNGVGSLDPAFANTPPNMWAVNQLFNGLVELDKNFNVVPALCESWSLSNDGKTYTFEIRKGVKFHDSEVFPDGKGREVTAQDFVYSFKRLEDESTASTGRWIFHGKVLKNKLGKLHDSAIVAINDYRLRIKLQQPFPPFIKLLSMQYAYVVPKEAIDKYGKDFRAKPVGTGPFFFKTWDESNLLVFLKNQNYWKKDENGVQLPYLDAVNISFIADENMAFINFEQKKLDFLSGINENSRDMILDHRGNVKSEFSAKFKVHRLLYLNTEYLGFQLDTSVYEDKNHPILNKKVRQALSYAIDREELIDYMRNGLGVPGTAGFVPYPLLFKHKIKGYNYNPEKAIALLKAAGYHNKKINLTLYTTAPYKQISEYLQKAWSKIGVQVTIEVNQASTHRDLANKGLLPFFRASWVGDYMDTENYMSVFLSDNFAPSGPNKARYHSEDFDNLYEEALVELDSDKREDIYLKMDQVLMDDCPIIVLFYDELLRLTHNNIHGLEANPMNMLFLESVKKD